MFVLTDISCALGDGQVGASAPRSSLVVPLAATAVGPGGVVLTLTAQLLCVIHTAVSVKIALAPVKEGEEGFQDGDERGPSCQHG